MMTETSTGERRARPSEIDAALQEVLRSVPFHGSRQCQTLLKYLVEHARDGHDGALKERTIGVEIFGRKPDYNTAEDAVVRGRVGEVRKRLAQYYQSDEGRNAEVQIVLPTGCYRPAFVVRSNGNGNQGSQSDGAASGETAQPGAERVEQETVETPAITSGGARRRLWAFAGLATCVVVAGAWAGVAYWTKSEFDLFWRPILESKKAVLIYTGAAPVYIPTSEAIEKLLTQHAGGEPTLPATEWKLPAPEEGALTASDLWVDRVGFTGSGDNTASVNIAVLLAAHHRSFSLRSGADLPFVDLHGSPAVMIGAVNNYWTIDMTRELPFYFDRMLRIRERGGEGRVWTTRLGANAEIHEDYALVSRIFDTMTGSPTISIAGITTCGTRAAGEFVTDPAELKKLKGVPRDAMKGKNLAMVLHTTLEDCSPTSVDVVALRSW